MSLLTSSSLPPFALIDSSFFYKYIDRSEKRHQEAVDLLHQLVNAGTQLVTTNFLVAESHSLVLARTKRIDRGIEFLDLVQGSDYLTSLRVTPQDEARAHQIVRQYTDKRFSLVDATSFAVMERLQIDHALTFDRNFRQYRFIMLPLEQ